MNIPKNLPHCVKCSNFIQALGTDIIYIKYEFENEVKT
ncbi:hypothetical protein SDC9_56129 [bioreactor metagenome]|uniref:Uncharacterized protein n=1 Tax=bioreactor metagenome TaxID=1076179 RepID=A0A644X101_9ZZZZ